MAIYSLDDGGFRIDLIMSKFPHVHFLCELGKCCYLVLQQKEEAIGFNKDTGWRNRIATWLFYVSFNTLLLLLITSDSIE